MIELGFYEKVIKSPKGKNLIAKILSIVIFAVTVLALLLSALFAAISPILAIALIALLSLALYIIMIRTSPEYEYSISETEITLAKIYAKRRRKEIFSAEPKSILFIAPATEDNMNKAQEYRPTEQYEIYLPNTENKLWLVVFENDEEENTLFVFEAEDGISKLLRTLKPSAMTLR